MGRSHEGPFTLIRMTSVDVKPTPAALIVTFALPAAADVGLIEVSTG